MKKSLLSFLTIIITTLAVNSQDLPNPSANLQVLPAGSYVIPMDNTLQGDKALGGTNAKFNLTSYGLICHLLNYNVKIKWVIKAGKVKDGVDFTASAQMIKPTLEGSSNTRSFIAGPFVIFAADTTGVASLINNFYSQHGLSGNDRPKVFKTITSTPGVDIRYDLTGFKPKAAILDDGGNEDIHVGYMMAAAVPAINYSISDGVSLQQNCYTFASEPHNSKTGAAVDSAIVHIKQFVLSGRNFLAECAAIRTYENNPLGRFQTTTGIDDINANVSTNVTYPYADLGFYQFEGAYDASTGGSVKNWKPLATQNTTSFSKATGTGTNSAVQALSFCKMVSSGLGGMVFYLGNHKFTGNNDADINGIRIYMNAFLTPVAFNSYCETMPNQPLAVKLISFNGFLNNDINKVSLTWTVAENQNLSQFEVERSLDGTNFNTAALVFSTEKSGDENYQFAQAASTSVVYYRLKITDNSGVVTYSKVLVFKAGASRDFQLKVLNNPVVSDKLNLSFETSNNSVTITMVDMTGRQVFHQKLSSSKGSNIVSLNLPVLNNGMYVVDLFDGITHSAAKFIKQ